MRSINAVTLVVAVILPILFVGLFAITASRAESDVPISLTAGSTGDSAQCANQSRTADGPVDARAIRCAVRNLSAFSDPKTDEARSLRWDWRIASDTPAPTSSSRTPGLFAR